MAVNPNISLAVKGLELQDPLAQYGKIAAIQSAQNQNSLAQYQLGAAQRTEAKDIARTNALSQAGTDETAIGNALLRAGDIAGYSSFVKSAEERKTQKLTQAKTQSELIDGKLKQSRQFLDTINPSDPQAPALYMAWHEANHKDPILGPVLEARGVTADQSRARIAQAIQAGPQAFMDLINQSKLGTEKFMEMNKPTNTPQTLGGTVRVLQTPGLGGAATVVPGSEASVTNTPYQTEQLGISRGQLGVAQGNLAVNQSRLGLEERRVKTAEEQQRNASDPAFQQSMAAAKATGEAIAKGDVAAVQKLPQIITRADQAINLIDTMVGKQATKDASGKVTPGTQPHPGFENAVGFGLGQRFVPGTDAAGFQAMYDQVKGGSFLEAFESLKGGGAISEKEGEKATSAINRMSLATSEAEFKSAAREFQSVIRNGVKLAKERAAKVQPRAAGAAPSANDPLGLR